MSVHLVLHFNGHVANKPGKRGSATRETNFIRAVERDSVFFLFITTVKQNMYIVVLPSTFNEIMQV
jgi:hypothetical protein